MPLLELSLFNFRNYHRERFEFSAGLNFIYGDNAQGKTSLLEAIYFLTVGRSFRTRYAKELLRFGESFFSLEARFTKEALEHHITIQADGLKRHIHLNQTPCKSFLEIFGLLKSVVLSPEDYTLISGPPALRRKYLDLQIAQADQQYLCKLARYQEALKQRNALLKKRRPQTLCIWEKEMAHSGAYLILSRYKCLDALTEHVRENHQILCQKKEELSIQYVHSYLDKLDPQKLEEDLLTIFESSREKDLQWGSTQKGPHKDDIAILLNDKPAKLFASEGQQRSLAASLRLGEWDLLKKTTCESPIMIVDDMDISLDDKRKSSLLEKLTTCDQVFLTSPEKSSEKLFLPKDTSYFAISEGKSNHQPVH